MNNAMSNLLFIAIEVTAGRLDLSDAVRVEVERLDVNTYGADGEYIDYVSVDSERAGYDNYMFELTPAEYSIEEVQSYMATSYSAELTEYNLGRRKAVERIAALTPEVTVLMNELLELAHKYDIPANLNIAGTTNDFRLIDAVDWDSSSMYC